MVVRDRSADCYGTPYFALSVGAAARGFSDRLNRQEAENVMYDHPEDFELYEIGSYHDVTAELTSHAPRLVMTGSAAVKDRK